MRSRNRFLLDVFVCAPFILAASLLGCGGNPTEPPPHSDLQVHVVLPEYQFEENTAIRINQGLLDSLAQEYVKGHGVTNEDILSFLFSFVPLTAFDRIGDSEVSQVEDLEVEDLEGLLYLSGFFGGIWLKGALESGPVHITEDPLHIGGDRRAMDLFSLVAGVVEELNHLARYSESIAVQQFLLNGTDPFIILYGYNRGYLQSILERPPVGATPPAGYLLCPHFLDCRTPIHGLSLLEELMPVAENLIEPPDDRWMRMRERVDLRGPSAFDMGYTVWSRFLSTEDMQPEAYLYLLDLSSGFLAYCQVLALSAMDAWVHEDDGRGRRSVALAAGMMAWAGGYVVGLTSDYPGDHLPRMEITP